MYDNVPRGVFRRCWWAPCGSPVRPTAQRPTGHARPCARPVWIPGRCGPTRHGGGRNDRPGLQQALTAVQPGDDLLVWPLDRLGRSLSPRLSSVLTLQSQGAVCRSLTAQGRRAPHTGLLVGTFGTRMPLSRRPKTQRSRPEREGESWSNV